MLERITKLLKANIPDMPELIRPEDRFLEDLKFCSLDIYHMAALVEEELCCVLPDDDLAKIRTVGELIRYLEAGEGGVR